MYCETNVHVECVRWMIVACVVCSACCAEKAFYVFILMSHVIYESYVRFVDLHNVTHLTRFRKRTVTSYVVTSTELYSRAREVCTLPRPMPMEVGACQLSRAHDRPSVKPSVTAAAP